MILTGSTKSHPRVVSHTMPVSVPVKKYLERWKPSIYLATQDDFVGLWLINAFTRKTTQVKCFSKEVALRRGYTESWQYSIPLRYQDNVLLPERRLIQFNNIVMKFIYLEILHDMEILRLTGNVFNIQQAINDFRVRYGMYEKDLNDERIRKIYLRFRERNNTVRSEFSNFMPGMLLGKI